MRNHHCQIPKTKLFYHLWDILTKGQAKAQLERFWDLLWRQAGNRTQGRGTGLHPRSRGSTGEMALGGWTQWFLEPHGERSSAHHLLQKESTEVASPYSPLHPHTQASREEHVDKADGNMQGGTQMSQLHQRSGMVSTFWKQSRDMGFREDDTNGSFPRRLK